MGTMSQDGVNDKNSETVGHYLFLRQPPIPDFLIFWN